MTAIGASAIKFLQKAIVDIICRPAFCNRIFLQVCVTVIEFTKVNKWFGALHVLSDIDLSIAAGNVVVVCGPERQRQEHV